jgi:hypothetical protein
MSARLSIRQTAVQVLRAMGYLTPNDSSVEENVLKVVAEWLDLNVAQLAGTNRQLWLLEEIPIPLVANATSYSLSPQNTSSSRNLALATNEQDLVRANNVPVDGMQFPVDAWTRRTGQSADCNQPVRIMRHWEYDELGQKTRAGAPVTDIYITRHTEPVLYPYPVPDTDEWTIYLRVQTFAPDISALGRERVHALRQSWQRWLIWQAAADCSRGPVRTLPQAEIDNKQSVADKALSGLQGFENDDHYKPHRVAVNEF